MRVGKGAGPDGQNLQVIPFQERADFDASALIPETTVWQVADIFTTFNGSWEPSPEDQFAIDQWARDDYLFPWGNACGNDSAGGDTHLFAVAIGSDEQCGVVHGKQFIAWTDGFTKLGDQSYQDFVTRRADQQHGWVNWFAPNGYYPDKGQAGPWCWCPLGASDVIDGGGLPYNRHVSWFAVWERMTYAEYLIEKDDSGTGSQPGTDLMFLQQLALAMTAVPVEVISTPTGSIYRLLTPEEIVTRAVLIQQGLIEAHRSQSGGAN